MKLSSRRRQKSQSLSGRCEIKFGPILSLLQSSAFFVTDTQGSAKPPPWAKFLLRLRRTQEANVAESLLTIG